jgi:hypothetical protein
MLLQGCFQALLLSTHKSIIGRSTAQHMIRTVVLIHLGVVWSVAHLSSRISRFDRATAKRALLFCSLAKKRILVAPN